MSTKNDIILGAYDEMMISGLTVAPDPESMQLALNRLEDMMSDFFKEASKKLQAISVDKKEFFNSKETYIKEGE